MRRSSLIWVLAIVVSTAAGLAQTSSGGPYKVLQKAKVGGEGGTDYLNADSASRRLYITRNATRGTPATDTAPAVEPAVARISVFDLDKLTLLDEIPVTGNANG